MGNALHLPDTCLELLGLSLGLIDVSALGKPEIDHELRPCRWREETLLHKSKAKHSGNEDPSHRSNCNPAEADTGGKQPTVTAIERGIVWILLALILGILSCIILRIIFRLGSFEKHRPEQWRKCHRRHPAE